MQQPQRPPSSPPPRRGIVTDDEVAEILDVLANQAEEFAEAKAEVTMIEHLLDRVRYGRILESTGGSADRRKAEAITSAEYLKLIHRQNAAIKRYESMLARRKAWELRIAVWQSEGANIRAATSVR